MASPTSGSDISIKTVLEVARRRIWLVLAATVLVSTAAAFYAYHQPVLYRAQALMGVESNARDFIQKTEGSARVQDQLLTIRQVLLSPQVLEPVMDNYRLYPKPGGKFADGDLEKMRTNVKITVETDDTFHLGYEGSDRQRVTDVTNALAHGFLEHLGENRKQQMTEATALLDAELDKLRATLDEQEEQVKRYKQRAVNELPDRLDS